MATVSGSVSTTTRNPRHWQLAVLVMETLPEITTNFGHQIRSFDHLVGDGEHDMPTTFYGPATGPKSGGGMRCFVPASYAEAIRKRIGSENGFPINIIPTGSFAGTGPARRVPSGAVASRTRSYT